MFVLKGYFSKALEFENDVDLSFRVIRIQFRLKQDSDKELAFLAFQIQLGPCSGFCSELNKTWKSNHMWPEGTGYRISGTIRILLFTWKRISGPEMLSLPITIMFPSGSRILFSGKFSSDMLYKIRQITRKSGTDIFLI